MSNEKIIKKIIDSEEILRIRTESNNIKVLFNERQINTFPIRIIILKFGERKSLIGLWGNRIFKGGIDLGNLEVLMNYNDMKKNKTKYIYIVTNDSKYLIKEGGKEDIEVIIYLRNDKLINFINVGYNVIRNENNISFIHENVDKVCETFITDKIKSMFPETFSIIEEFNNEN